MEHGQRAERAAVKALARHTVQRGHGIQALRKQAYTYTLCSTESAAGHDEDTHRRAKGNGSSETDGYSTLTLHFPTSIT